MTMSEQHKEALAQGRQDGRAVRRYLEALEARRPRRGRPVDRNATEALLKSVQTELADTGNDSLTRLQLAQRRIDLQSRLDSLAGADIDLSQLENAFLKAAPTYSERKGLTYAAWRAAGVSSAVLRKAGIKR